MKRIAIFTDIHANKEALITIIDDLEKERISDIYHIGDAIAIGPNPRETLDILINNNIKMIRGNHEDYYVDTVDNPPSNMDEGEIKHQRWTHLELGQKYRSLIRSLPYELSLNIDKVKIYLCHYPFEKDESGFKSFKNFNRDLIEDNVDEFFDDKDYDVFFYGHYHQFSDLKSKTTGRRYINPGSAGAYQGEYTQYTIIEIVDNNYNLIHKKLNYDKKKVVEEIRRKNVPEGEFIIENFYGWLE